MQISIAKRYVLSYDLAHYIFQFGVRMPCRYYYDKFKFLKTTYPFAPPNVQRSSLIHTYDVGELLEYLPPGVKVWRSPQKRYIASYEEVIKQKGIYSSEALGKLFAVLLQRTKLTKTPKNIRTLIEIQKFWRTYLSSQK